MKIKKKFRLLFSLTILMFCFLTSSVGVFADEAIDLGDLYGGEAAPETTLSKEDMKTYADGKITMAEIKQMVEQYAQGVGQYANASSEELEYIGEYFSYQTDMFENFATAVGDEPCGDYQSYDDIKIEELEDGNINVSSTLHFSKRDLKMTMHVSIFDTLGPVPKSIEFGLPDSAQEGVAEKLVSGGANTLMGMGTVFVVLIFICLIISCFNFIPKISAKFKSGKDKQGKISDEKIVENNIENIENTVDDTELIAVIAAAIAASENTSTDSFVVRSIRRC